ncbi:MAG: S8 family serine peptidase [Ilumatobacteraceae bacterium]
MRLQSLIIVATCTLAVGHVSTASASRPTPGDRISVASTTPAARAPHAPDVVLVGFDRAASASDRAAARAQVAVDTAEQLSPLAADVERWHLAAGVGVDRAIAALSGLPGVRYVEPDYLVTPAATSNDTYVTDGTLWGMEGDTTSPSNTYGSQAAEAWARGYTGSSSVAVGIVDEGIQITHPELVDNIWINRAEQNGVAGTDDDGNGYIDDVNGWDFFNNDASVYNAGASGYDDMHGTHVAGTIGAKGGNGAGVAGVNWNVTLVPAKFIGPTGGLISDAVRALDYLTDLKSRHGLRLVATNNSWNGGDFAQTLADAINRGGDAGILFVAAAGNSTSNNDLVPTYPADYQCTTATRQWDCLVSVAAIDSSGAIYSSSNYGPTTVDIAAPGVGITSTIPTDTYASWTGTSMAAPHVAGSIALCAAANAALTPTQLRAAVLDTMVPTAALAGRTALAGRLDTSSALRACVGGSAPSGSPSGISATATAWNRATVTWTDGVSGETQWVVQRAVQAGSCGTFATVGTFGENVTSFYDTGLTGSSTYCYRVQATGGATSTSVSSTATASTPAMPPQPVPYTCSSVAYSWIDQTSGATQRVLADDAYVAVTLPFTFPFYGVDQTSVSVSSNGYIRFGTGDATLQLNTTLPNIQDPNNIVAAYWDDLNPPAGGSIWSIVRGTAPSRTFTASWVDVFRLGTTTDPISFQIVLDEATKAVTINYKDTVSAMSTNGGSATAGVENGDGEMGTQISANKAVLQSGTSYRCSNAPLAPVAVSTSSLPVGTTTAAYSTTLAATGGTGTYTWSVTSGSLPTGLTLASSGTLSGTPSATGTYTFTVTARDTALPTGNSAAKQFSIPVTTPVTVGTTSPMVGGIVGVAYSQTLAATGGTGSFTWTKTSGTLPGGLTLSTGGVLSGTPTAAGSFTFTVTATDSAGRTGSKSMSLTVGSNTPPGAFAKSSPKAAATGIKLTSSLTWAASTGAARYEYCVDTTNDNACAGSWISTGTTRSATPAGLLKNTVYYWQIRAVNASGTTYANAGTWWAFTTVLR